MQFNDTTNNSGICQEIDRICGTTVNTFPLKDKAARVNMAIDRFSHLAMQYDGDWEFDDQNWLDEPIEYTDLVSGQQDYSLSSDALMVVKALAKDSNGDWHELSPVETNSPESKNIWELPTNNTGTPERYDLFSASIFLDPIPDYNSTNGLQVIYKRNGYRFVYTDTTREPGIPSLFHPYIARLASLPYLIEHNLPQKRDLDILIQKDELAIADFFDARDVGKRDLINFKWRSSR